MRFAISYMLASLAVAACGGGTERAGSERIISPVGMSGSVEFDRHILVDQFGYRPEDPKVAVIRDPRRGYDAGDRFSPGSLYQVRRATDGAVVFSGRPSPWRGGETQASSGDAGWWFDFGTVTGAGTYFIYDVERKLRSATFKVQQDVYKTILRTAMRMFFYQRSGFAKQRPFAGGCWTDTPAYIGRGQDIEARDITDKDNRAKVRNLYGGWFDAGDTNKYVTFAAQPVHQLLTAYQEHPAVFTDDFGIPESGNGVPDILDEIKWETDWLKRMQFEDGRAALKVGETADTTGIRPGLDTNARFYIPACTSATIAIAGVFAHAALVYGAVGKLQAESAELAVRAVRAWNNYQHAARQTHCDSGIVRAGNADWSAEEQDSAAVVAAIYLFALTGDPSYHQYMQAHYKQLRPYRDQGWSRYNPEQGEALLFYTTLPNADLGIKAAIRADKARDAEAGNQIYGFQPNDDLYRAFIQDEQYHWGSNGPRANYGNSNIDMLTYGISSPKQADFGTRALEILHYFHGVNPFGMTYMSNMYALGATRSVNEIYHQWFWHGTKWGDALRSECGPAPGYVPGGPNADAVKNGVPPTLAPPAGQPPQKSYRDWNAGWPESSWAVTEPGIYYQAAYVELLSKFAD